MVLIHNQNPHTKTPTLWERPEKVLYASDGRMRVNAIHIAKCLGVNRTYISRILRGEVNPSLRIAKGIAMYLNISLGELYERLGLGLRNPNVITIVQEKNYQKELRQEALDNPELHAKIDL